jgi:uncharacterized protein (TIGR02453 family)
MPKKSSIGIPVSVFDFLKDIGKHNNRVWFEKHKDRYTGSLDQMICFAEALLEEMNKHDLIETPSGKKSLFRIYRDVRFSKEKTPYKTSWSGRFSRSTSSLRGGYYYHIEPGNSYVSGGFFNPNPADLGRIREDIALNYPDWNKVLKSKARIFGVLEGECLKNAPSGYSINHPAIELLRHKQFILRHRFTDKEVLGPGFLTLLNNTFMQMRPYFDYMSEVLTTDSNGVPVNESH